MKIDVRKEVKSYMRPYWYQFHCSRRHKKALYNLMVSTGEEFLDVNPKASLEDLHSYWGKPSRIFQDFQDAMGKGEVWKSYRHSLWITATVCIAVALVVLLIAYWLIIHYVGSPEIIYLS